MAFVNIHSIPGLAVSITYWNTVTQVPTPVTPLSLVSGVYSLPTGVTEWDRAVFEITNFAGAVLPIDGRISVVGAQVGGPYDGLIGIASGSTFGSTIAQQTFPPDTPYAGSKSAPMDTTDRFLIFGHNSGSGPDIQTLTSLVIELDGTFATPDFWTDFKNTYEDVELHRPTEATIVPEVVGQPALPALMLCHTTPDVPGPGVGGSGDDGGGGGSGPAPGEVNYPLCVILRDNDYPSGFKQCCRAAPGAEIVCTGI